MPDERWDEAREGFKESIKAGFGILGALKEALEETFEEAMKEREFGPDRARDAFRETVRRAQDTMDQARDRFDFVSRRDFEALKAQVDALRQQVETHLSNAVHHTPGGASSAAGAPAGSGSAGEPGVGGSATAAADSTTDAGGAAGGLYHGEIHTHPGSASPPDQGSTAGGSGLAGEDRSRDIPPGEGD